MTAQVRPDGAYYVWRAPRETLPTPQIATTIEQAELAGLTPEKRAEVQKRATEGNNTVSEVLQTILLNGIKSKHPASRIVALDFARGIAVVEVQSGGTVRCQL